MENYDNFLFKCRKTLKNNGKNFSKNQKKLIKAIYNLYGEFTPLDISRYIGSGFSLDDIMNTLSYLEEDSIIFKVEDKKELTYSRVLNSHINDKDSSTLNKQTDDVSSVNYMNFEAEVIESINNKMDYENIYLHIKELYPTVEELSISKLINAYNLLNESYYISSELKTYLQTPQFIESNATFILSLAKLYFHADKINIQDGEIVISKEVFLPTIEEKTLNIDEVKIISMVLKKIKYDRLKDKDLEKINELKEYKEHENLYTLLIRAIESKYLIKEFDDNKCNMTKDELEKFLESK